MQAGKERIHSNSFLGNIKFLGAPNTLVNISLEKASVPS